MIDVMTRPSKELLIFSNEIEDWILSEEETPNGLVFSFKPETPKSILELFDRIKSELSFVA
ncbi:hypothetical protein [Streptococcus suis]